VTHPYNPEDTTEGKRNLRSAFENSDDVKKWKIAELAQKQFEKETRAITSTSK